MPKEYFNTFSKLDKEDALCYNPPDQYEPNGMPILMSIPHTPLDVLLVSDLHDAAPAAPASIEGAVLLRKAFRRLRAVGVEVNLLIILGDVTAKGAENRLRAVAEEASRADTPVLAIPGNHDGDIQRFAEMFDCQPGLHEINGYGFLLFHDTVGHDDVTTRPADPLALPARMASERPDLNLIALQHNPIHPPIQHEYPYRLANADQVMTTYQEAGVTLSLSGHYHPGQPVHRVNGVTYYTLPALGDSPFRLAHLRLDDGQEPQINEYTLKIGAEGLVDTHCHTEYAYCAATVEAERNIAIAQTLGLRAVSLIEHTFQLYFDREEAWSYRWQTDDGMVQRAWLSGRGRMPAYRAFVQALRDRHAGLVRLGLELDLRADGSLLLAPEDRTGWDLLVGAIHAIPEFDDHRTTQAQAERLFLRETERLLSHPIQVLAHPFRFFRWAKLEQPTHLYATVAEMLAQSGVAAEVNFHNNAPPLSFLEACLSRGVRLALATDSHDLAEVGDLHPHLDILLNHLDIRAADLSTLLYHPNDES